jgi:transposase
MNKDSNSVERVIGFDSHPDSFTAALIRGQTPAQAQVEKVYNKIPISHLKRWALKNTIETDLFVLEASGNSFQVVRTLEAINRKALVLESRHLGKLKEAHSNNDKISAIRIGTAYLAGTARPVWVPDLKTQEWRDWFLADKKAVKRTTQLRNRISSYLSDNGVRLQVPKVIVDPGVPEIISKAKNWSSGQSQVLQIMFGDLHHAEQQKAQWSSLIAQEVISNPLLLSLVRLCGIRQKIAFALGAIIGDIHRFSEPRKLVKYVGLNPAMDHSGEGGWDGGIGAHGRSDLRAMLIEAAQALMRSKHPLAKWGKKLAARKGKPTLAVAAVARKLVVAVWYLMMGRWTTAEEIDQQLSLKIGKIISAVGRDGLKRSGQTRKQLRDKIEESLKKGRVYYLDPDKKFTPKKNPKSEPPRLKTGLKAEYGFA